MGWAGRHLWLPDREEIIGVRSVCPQVPPRFSLSQIFPLDASATRGMWSGTEKQIPLRLRRVGMTKQFVGCEVR